MNDSLLSVDGVNTYYGQSHVLQDVSLKVSSGAVVALLGRNGAGKSTLLKSIMGISPAMHGTILFAGEEIEHLPPHLIARRGVAYVPEGRGVFASLTVEEHLTMVHRSVSRERLLSVEEIYERFPLLADRRRNRGNELSGGEQQMLAIARAIALSPQLLLLDEPTEGLAPIVVDCIAGIVMDLRASGMTMLMVEQNYSFISEVAECVYVLGKGRIRWHGSATDFDAKPDVRSMWLAV